MTTSYLFVDVFVFVDVGGPGKLLLLNVHCTKFGDGCTFRIEQFFSSVPWTIYRISLCLIKKNESNDQCYKINTIHAFFDQWCKPKKMNFTKLTIKCHQKSELVIDFANCLYQ